MYFLDRPAIVIYCANILFITIFQNNLWDYVARRPEFLKDIDETQTRFYRRACNVAMLNAVFALVLAFFHPLIAFIVLLARLPMILFTRRFYKYYDGEQPSRKRKIK
jgi:fatty acid desaturase